MKSININLASIKRLFAKKPKLAGLRNPTKDWLQIIIVTAVGSLIICLLGIFLFNGVEKGILFVPDPPPGNEQAVFDGTSISKVGSYYDQKEADLDALKATSTVRVDPAL